MNEKIKNLRKILKYSDPEPTELLVGLISGLMIPLFLIQRHQTNYQKQF